MVNTEFQGDLRKPAFFLHSSCTCKPVIVILFLSRTYCVSTDSVCNLSDAASEFQTVIMFVVIELQTCFAHNVDSMVYLHTRFHMPGSNG